MANSNCLINRNNFFKTDKELYIVILEWREKEHDAFIHNEVKKDPVVWNIYIFTIAAKASVNLFYLHISSKFHDDFMGVAFFAVVDSDFVQ